MMLLPGTRKLAHYPLPSEVLFYMMRSVQYLIPIKVHYLIRISVWGALIISPFDLIVYQQLQFLLVSWKLSFNYATKKHRPEIHYGLDGCRVQLMHQPLMSFFTGERDAFNLERRCDVCENRLIETRAKFQS